MKKVLSLILVVFMLFSIMSLSALATDEENVTDVSNDFAEMEDEEIDFICTSRPASPRHAKTACTQPAGAPLPLPPASPAHHTIGQNDSDCGAPTPDSSRSAPALPQGRAKSVQ